MKDYKECLTNEELYILVTKFEAGAWQLVYEGTSYSNSMRTRSEVRAKSYSG